MHAGIQILPHVVWHTINKWCKNKEAAQAAFLDVTALIGLPGREVKTQSGKGKAIIKADPSALSGPEVKRMIEGHEVAMDAVISSSYPIQPKLKKVWDAYIAMTTLWRVDPRKDIDDRKRASGAPRDAIEQFVAVFLDSATAKDVTPYMHGVD
eukprot:jgi/Tetstr1/458681/TSEL_045071.t1